MQQVNVGQFGAIGGRCIDKGAVNAQYHVVEAGPDKDLAHDMAEEAAFHISAEFRVERGDRCVSFSVIGEEGLEMAETSTEGFRRADPRHVLGPMHGGERIRHVIGWPEEFVDIDMGKPVNLGLALIGMGRIAGLADLMLGRTLDAASFPVLRVALDDADLGVFGQKRFGFGAGGVEIKIKPMASQFEVMRGKAKDRCCVGLYS